MGFNGGARDPRTYAIIGACMEVHRTLGYGFLEAVYQEALAKEFVARGISFSREVAIPVRYKTQLLGCYYKADFVCFGEVIVELKAMGRTTSVEESQILNYLKATGFEVGILVNFGARSLEYRRFISSNLRESAKSADSPFGDIVRSFSAAKRLLLVTHARPDGDTLGSAVALALAANAQGKEASVCVIGAVPLRYQFLFDRIKPVGPEQFDGQAGEADVVAIIDCSVFSQLDGLEQSIRAHSDKVVVIDHHSTPEQISPLQWIDSSAAAVGVMAAELIEALGWPLDAEIAQALLTAITSDTGWFQFANTDPRCLEAAARCLEAGVRTDRLYARLFQCDRPQRLALLARVLSSMELYCNNRLAVCTIRATDFEQTGARPDETENLVNEPLRMGCVETAVMLVQNPSGTPVRAVSSSADSACKQGEETHGQDAHATGSGTPVRAVSSPIVRVSLRSRDALDVAAVARQFGGGGHGRAAGFRKDEDIDALKGKVIEVCARELKKVGLG